jgi:hypothetical protein
MRFRFADVLEPLNLGRNFGQALELCCDENPFAGLN